MSSKPVGSKAGTPAVLPGTHHGRSAERAVVVIQRFAKAHRSLARCQATLIRDLLALLAGLKPAVMLDYCFKLPVDVLQQLLAELTQALPQPGTPLLGVILWS